MAGAKLKQSHSGALALIAFARNMAMICVAGQWEWAVHHAHVVALEWIGRNQADSGRAVVGKQFKRNYVRALVSVLYHSRARKAPLFSKRTPAHTHTHISRIS